MADRRGAYRDLVGRPEGKRRLGRPRCRWGIILKRGFIWLKIGTSGVFL
jgi:hypothetical protein